MSTTPRPLSPTATDAITKARARRYERETQAEAAEMARRGRCECALPLPCSHCKADDARKAKTLFASL